MKTFLINLDRSPERLQYMDELLNRRGVPYIRVSAVDGTVIDRPAYASSSLTMPEIGCFLSHRSIWELMVSEDIPVALVLEDDIEISPGLAQLIDNPQWLPGDDFIVKLDTTGTRVALTETKITVPTQRRLLELNGQHLCTSGYILSRSAASKLLELSTTLHDPVDVFLFEDRQKRRNESPVFQMVPAPIRQKMIVEDVAGTVFETTIPKDHIVQPVRRIGLPAKAWRELKRAVRKTTRSVAVSLQLTSERHMKAEYR
ncbi:glycosyltransferase family 25 protein [Nitratireductor aquimarinus]|uniref:glycosyltransferase family 25 protein n=1 Tax=Nitratireductor TaxID=245876 RepID=UPI0019D3A035|nr:MULTISPECIES: glycosyltransferase family 25 protein [Nitratireductor]MBN7764058.1 glycosyltransferase family 25 protein [Nitratireductor aquibiodomus]MBN8244699.1 glycosyltransferase family 25 protein [Nitratireductor aquimarinus]MBY6133086.1 glycosyltransferase family 25 protein [Nitratireductor aquimarinus]MCA1305020.1 glycosyltransferase family 25 protein [Nitratireductor aquimarinus]